MTPEMTISRGAPPAAPPAKAVPQAAVSVAEAKAKMEAQVQAALQRQLTKVRPERAEPLLWWDVFIVGVVQPGAGTVPPGGFAGPLLPGDVVRVGEQAQIFTVLLLNPIFPFFGPTACDILSNFGLPVTIQYQTLNLTTGTPGPANVNVTHSLALIPNQCFLVDVLDFRAEQEECIFETNVCARILGCTGIINPPFAGFATAALDIDNIIAQFLGEVPGVPAPAPVQSFGQGCRWMVYR